MTAIKSVRKKWVKMMIGFDHSSAPQGDDGEKLAGFIIPSAPNNSRRSKLNHVEPSRPKSGLRRCSWRISQINRSVEGGILASRITKFSVINPIKTTQSEPTHHHVNHFSLFGHQKERNSVNMLGILGM
jgi:hypothetical protein